MIWLISKVTIASVDFVRVFRFDHDQLHKMKYYQESEARSIARFRFDLHYLLYRHLFLTRKEPDWLIEWVQHILLAKR